MIVSLHVATGGLVGRLAGSRAQALALGLAAHAAGDAVPHQDVASRRFETVSGIACLGLLAAACGPTSREVTGAIAASAPDLEHVIRFPRPGGRKLFPSHRVHGWHRSGGLPATVQLAAAGALLGALVAGRLYGRVGR